MSSPPQAVDAVAEPDDGEVLFCGASASSRSSQLPLSNASVGARANGDGVGGDPHRDGDRLPASPGAAAQYPPANGSTEGAGPTPSNGAGAGPLSALRRQLSELSARVNTAAERERCGPPKPSGKPTAPFGGRWKKKATKREDREKKDDSEGDGDANEGRKRSRDSDRPATSPPTEAPQKGRRGAAGRSPAKPRGKKPSNAKQTRLKGAKDGKGKADGGGGRPQPQWHTLLPWGNGSATDGAANPSASPSTAASHIPFTWLDSDDAVATLFHQLTCALNDPDRIQAPPLFAGVLYATGDTNFSLSSVSRGRALLPGSGAPAARGGEDAAPCGEDTVGAVSSGAASPRQAHRCVSHVVVRWREKVYCMPARRFGFPLLLRVLRELVGVELVTFNAPALLLALLCFAGGDLFTHCVSDVRVMAWMSSLTPPAAVSGGEEEESRSGAATWNAVFHDYTALVEQYGGSLGVTPAGRHTAAAPPPHLGSDRCRHEAHEAAGLQQLVNETYHLASLYRTLYGVLGSKGLLQAFLRQEKRIPLFIAAMKREGVCVDVREVQRFKAYCAEQMHHWRTRACSLLPQLPNFNIQSPDQVRVALYDVLALDKYLLHPNHPQQGGQSGDAPLDDDDDGTTVPNAVSVTRGGKLSTAEETLRVLAAYHELPRCIMLHRKVAKVLQTYVDGMMSFAVPRECAADKPSAEEEERKEGSGSSAFQDAPLRTRSAPGPVSPQRAEEEEEEGREGGDGGLAHHGDRGGNGPRSRSSSSAAPPAAADYMLLHPNFLQEGTDTGRLSCVEPNLQNLPRAAMGGLQERPSSGDGAPSSRAASPSDSPAPPPPAAASGGGEEEGKEKELLLFRRCFVAPSSEHLLLSVDYQQIELRVLAHLCADANLINALTSGHADIHRSIAEVLFKKAPVTAEERNLSKRVVFGVLYGAGPRTLASQMGVTVERAVFVSSLLKGAFPSIHTYHKKTLEQGREDGFVRTISGRIRHLPDINSPVMSRRAGAERQAFNTVVQGSAADVMKMGMLAVERDVLRPLRDDVQLLMQIHDEMIFSVKREKLPLVVPLVARAMSRAMSLLVPLSVTAKFGPSLGELQEWTVDHELGLA